MNEYVEKLKKDLGFSNSFDLTFREVITSCHKFHVIFFNFLINNSAIVKIIYSLNNYNSKNGIDHLSKVILNEATFISNDYEEIYDSILNGNVVIFLDKDKSALICEVRNYPTRSISEPDSVKMVSQKILLLILV